MKTKLILVLIEGFTLLLLLWMIAPFIINIGKVPKQLLNSTIDGGLNYILWISIWVLLPIFLWIITLTATISDLLKKMK